MVARLFQSSIINFGHTNFWPTILSMRSILFLALLISVNATGQDDKCICKQRSLTENFTRAPWIVLGKAIRPPKKPEDDQPSVSKKLIKTYEFSIESIYKASKDAKKAILKTGDIITVDVDHYPDCRTKLEFEQRYVLYIQHIENNIVFLNQCHFKYILDKKTLNSKKHIALLEMSNMSDIKNKVQKTPINDSKKIPKGSFSKRLEKYHKDD